MERRQLEYFVAVVEHGGFSRAAAAMHVSQSTLSRAVQSLETELGATLFRRTRGGAVPTDDAERLVRQARAALRELELMTAIARSASSEAAGSVEVAVTPGPAAEPLARIFRAVQARHPAVTLTAHAAAGADEAVALVSSGVAEIALFGETRPPAVAGLVSRQLGRDELLLALPPGSALAELGSIDAGRLAGLPFVLAPYGPTVGRFVDELAAAAGGLRVVARVSHRNAVLPFVANGVGAGIVSRLTRAHAAAAGVALRPFEPPRWVPTWACHRRRLSTPARLFLEAATALADGADA